MAVAAEAADGERDDGDGVGVDEGKDADEVALRQQLPPVVAAETHLEVQHRWDYELDMAEE